MARGADFDLARELGKPSFTPSVRDAPALIALIVDGAEPAAGRAQAALAQLGDAARTAVTRRLADASEIDDGGKARLIAVLGRRARAGDREARAHLITHVGDPAPRVRKAAAIALGKLTAALDDLGALDDARAALIARWDAGDAPADERRALAEALGKLGGADALARLHTIDAGGDRELARRRDRAVIMAERGAHRADDAISEIRADVAPPTPLPIELACRPGLAGLLVERLARFAPDARPLGDRGAALRLRAPLARLFEVRLWTAIAIPFALPGGELAAAITRTMTSPAVLAVLRAWTRGPIRWRLGFTRGHKRAIVWQVARDVSAAQPALINDPSATTWDAVVDADARSLALVPRRLTDPRFAYRVADVPAASHPTVAAALAEVAAPRPGERVWDPFCGSGLELIEAARRAGDPLRLYGSDLDGDALAAARANLAAAGVDAALAIADARSHDLADLDLIISNPPLGSRVQLDAGALLAAALPNFARALGRGGRLVWITPVARITSPVAERLGLVRRWSAAVDLGGVRGQLEQWQRR
ncbi:MAG TPA: methyltransferase domain-containing protein [Kofleriaceae bacterium]|nr:methyltransferase domain-containing protein [Kofleriaceae bacterium]